MLAPELDDLVLVEAQLSALVDGRSRPVAASDRGRLLGLGGAPRERRNVVDPAAAGEHVVRVLVVRLPKRARVRGDRVAADLNAGSARPRARARARPARPRATRRAVGACEAEFATRRRRPSASGKQREACVPEDREPERPLRAKRPTRASALARLRAAQSTRSRQERDRRGSRGSGGRRARRRTGGASRAAAATERRCPASGAGCRLRKRSRRRDSDRDLRRARPSSHERSNAVDRNEEEAVERLRVRGRDARNEAERPVVDEASSRSRRSCR